MEMPEISITLKIFCKKINSLGLLAYESTDSQPQDLHSQPPPGCVILHLTVPDNGDSLSLDERFWNQKRASGSHMLSKISR